jgi:hypothetical protein
MDNVIAQFLDGKLAQLNGIHITPVLNNGTGLATGAPIALALGANTITVTQAGTLLVYVPPGYGGSAVGAIVQGSPVTLVTGWNVLTITGTGTFTLTTTCSTTQTTIEVVGLRQIEAVVGVSLSGGYKLDPAACSVSGNKVTITPMYYTNNGGAAGPAIAVPNTVDLSAVVCNLTIVGY